MSGQDAAGRATEGLALAAVGGREAALALDAADPLGGFRERFAIADELVYLDGNSLGRPPRATLARLAGEALDGWGGRLIRGWEEGWMQLPVSVGDQLGEAALGAAPGQVVVADSTTVCLYKLAAAALDLRRDRDQIITDTANFPTDRYVLEGLAHARGLQIVWLEREPLQPPSVQSLAGLVGKRTALVCLSHVDYRSAAIADMAAISDLVRRAGALVLWDLSHSVGALPLRLDHDAADLAVGCTYKYLNAGPGAPAFMYVARRLQGQVRQPIWGWIGRRDPFAMAPGYQPAPGVQGLLSGTPPVLGLVCVQEGVALVAQAGIEAIRAKGVALCEYLIALADRRLAGSGVILCSPREAPRRGSHVALRHPEAARLCRELCAAGVIGDFRTPDMIRLGLSPLTTRFVDVFDALEALARLL